MTDFSFTEEIRRVLVPPRTGGHSAPSSLGAQRDATATTESGMVQPMRAPVQTAFADANDRGPAMRKAPNSFGWRPQHRMEVQGYRESYVDLGAVPAGGVVTLNPNIATNFIVTALGNLTVNLGAPEALPDPDPHGEEPQYLYGLKLWVKRPLGAQITWSNIKWPVDVIDPDGDGGTSDSLLGPATKGEYDSYVIVVIPGFGTFGYLAGRGY